MSNKNLPEIIQSMDEAVSIVMGASVVEGFQKAYMVADATMKLKSLLTKEYMAPIMALQGSKLGFKTDKDKDGGYPESVVKDCVIEAVLTGVNPVGNQFNIIAGNCYITKEGFGFLLSKISGLSYKIIPQLPRIGGDAKSAAVVMDITYSIDGITKSEKMDIPIRMNAMMGTDAVIGKATRKARAWLYNTITGSEIADGEAEEIKIVSEKPTPKTAEEIEIERISDMAKGCDTIEDLDYVGQSIPEKYQYILENRKKELDGNK